MGMSTPEHTDVCSATLGHVKQHTGSHLPDHEARFTLTRGGVHTGHQDLHSVTLGHKAVHSAAPGCAHRDMGMRTVLHRDTPARLHLGTCTPGSVSVRPLPAPRVPLPPGEAGRGARQGFPIGCRGCQRGGVTGEDRD